MAQGPGNNTPSHDPSQSLRDLQHFGEEGGVVPVIDVASTSTFLNPEDMAKAFRGEMPGCYLYSRHSNPSVLAFSKKLAAMEGTEAALGLSSGMAAINATIDQLLSSGDHIVSSRVVYGGTYALFANLLKRRGIEVSFVDFDNEQAIRKAIKPGRTKILYTESMSNPLLNVADIEGLAKIKNEFKLKLVVDNTFTPMLLHPAKLGADVVVHSCTKYISGASDMIAGAVCGSQDFINSLIDVNHGSVMLSGPVMDPRVAHELYLRLDHLEIRMKAHSECALAVARRVRELGAKVVYPGLEEHPHHKLLARITTPGFGFGGMVSIDCGTTEMALKFARRLQEEEFGLYAVSLGFSRTLMSCPSISTSSEIPQDEQDKMNLGPGILRLSIGFTGSQGVMLDRMTRVYREVFRSP